MRLASRITSFTETDTTQNQSFAYDLNDRLTTWTASTTNQAYTYDANGNRASHTIGVNSYAYTNAGSSNRLNSIAGPSAKSYTYDNAGNTTVSGALSFTYDGRGRMTAAGSNTYGINPLGERVAKTVGGTTTLFVYDPAGQLIGEYDASGTAIQETIYFNGTPVGIVKGGTLYYVYADQIGAPRLVTNTSNQAVWRWDQADPFGIAAPDQNPSGLGTFAYNLRFPGQYFDGETGLHYNYFRDYDPGIGRYVQSDPIGLAGGTNTYVYAYDNPLSFVDPKGLDVVITYFPGGVGHIGIGVNTTDTVGHYPVRKWESVSGICRTVPGVVSRDRTLQSPASIQSSRSLTIRTQPAQDSLMQRSLNRAQEGGAQNYNICTNQCTSFIIDVLREGGVPVPRDPGITPYGLFNQLEALNPTGR